MKKIMPAARTIAGTIWIHMGIRKAALLWPSPVPPIKFVWEKISTRGETKVFRNTTYSIADPEADHDTKSNSKLLHGNKRTAHFWRSKLSIV